LKTSFIVGLYNKYIDDLNNVREYQTKLYSRKGYSRVIREYPEPRPYEKYHLFRTLAYFALEYTRGFERSVLGRRLKPQFDDIEREVTYLLIREYRPSTVVEISPGGGWSTSWILNAIRDNGRGKLCSYDLVDHCTKTVPRDLSESRWVFIKGDVKKNIETLSDEIDYLFLDSDHSADFAHWYIRNVFPRLRSGSPVSIHDVFLPRDVLSRDGYTEPGVILEWLRHREIEYFTASRSEEKAVYYEIMSIKKKLGIEALIHPYQYNPTIFFLYEPAFKAS